MEFDATAGTITIPTTGIYKLTVNMSLLFDTVGNSEESFVLRLVRSASGDFDIPVAVGRNGGASSAYPALNFDAVAGETVKLQLGGASADLTTLVEALMSFEIESKHIR